MATTDKHPPRIDPLDATPRVKAKTDPYFGTRIVKAAGAKTVRPGDGNKPPHTREPYTTQGMEIDSTMKTGVIPMDRIQDIQRYYRRKMKYYETF